MLVLLARNLALNYIFDVYEGCIGFVFTAYQCVCVCVRVCVCVYVCINFFRQRFLKKLLDIEF